MSKPELESMRKAHIMDAALRVIAQHGFQNITLDDVAREAGLSKGGLVHYFPTKDALMVDTVRSFYQRIFERSRLKRDSYEGPLEQVLCYCEMLYDWSDPDIRSGYPLLFDFMALASQREEFRGLFHDWVENWIAILKDSIRNGIAAGQFMPADPEAMARTVSAIYQGIATRWYLDRDTHSTAWAVSALRRSVTLLLTAPEDAA